MSHLHLVGNESRVVDMNTYCDGEICSTCGGACIDTNQAGECRACETFAHNLRLMAAGVTRDKVTGRYAKVSIGGRK